ncbi:hypothetical protein [Grimontia hollisae]|uniref:hypothetical protein n=1 Tax=Grimontia hollisae TaxID=673 RepID=UPI000DFE6FAC|nr:hypothetical protein [Grimontia hollisae]STQ77443.1 Uncharacterised protein [Grimontia hollisae]
MTQPLVINSESDFLSYVLDVLVYEKQEQKLVFEGWPLVNINIKGERYHSTLPIKLMEAFIGLQQEFDKAYTWISYGTSNRQRLTNSDKELLELVFKIEEGSTQATGGGGDWLNSIFERLDVVLSDMNGRHKLILYTVIALSISGTIVGTNLLDNQTKRLTEEQKTEQIELLTNANNRSLEIMREIVLDRIEKDAPETKKVIEHFDEGYKGIVKAVPDAESMSIGDQTLTKDDIERISTKPDVVKQVEDSKDTFIIEYIKKRPAYWIVGVQPTSDPDASYSIKAELQYLTQIQKTALHDAFRDEIPIELHYQATYKNGDISAARLLNVDIPKIASDMVTATDETLKRTE